MHLKFIILTMIMFGLSSIATAQDSLERHVIQTVQAEDASTLNGFLRKESTSLANISSGEWFSINTGDLGAGVDTISLRYAKDDTSDANVEIRLESLKGRLISGGRIPSTRGLTQFEQVTFLVEGLSGTNKLFFVFTGSGNVGALDKIDFGRSQKNVLQAEDSRISFGIEKTRIGVTKINTGDWLRFRKVRLGNGFSDISLAYRKRSFLPARVTFHLDNLNGPIIGSIDLPRTGRMVDVITEKLLGNDGTRHVYARFSGLGKISMLDYISFEEQPLTTQLNLIDASIVRGMKYFGDAKYLRIDRDKADGFHWFRFNRTSVSYNPKIEFEYARGSRQPMRLEIRKNAATGKIIETIDLPYTGGYSDYQTISANLENTPQGIYHLVFRLVGTGRLNIGNIKLTRISEQETLPLGEQTLDKIVVDQFGYLPKMEKVALLRDSQVGFGSAEPDYVPGSEISLVDAARHEIVLTGTSESFQFGATDPLSGDRVWAFDFSAHQIPGTYYVYDPENYIRSATFEINENVYENVLRETFRTFVYQRSGFKKTADIVGENYADAASHIGPFQDSGARLFNDLRNRSTARDLSGGWYDAGDFNKYSNWTADYILGLLHAYHANPEAWEDDWNLPESGNGIPDILDEIRWGVEHLQRMQETASETSAENVGALLSVLESDDSVNRPSDNLQDSFYGLVSTSATFNAAGAYAFTAKTFESLPDQNFRDLAESLTESAVSAYDWAERNPNVRFNNAANGVGAGNSEVNSDYFLEAKQRIGAIYLYGLTQEQKYKNFIETDYRNSRLITLLWASPYESEEQTALLHYASLSGITQSVGTEINDRFNTIMDFAGNARPALQEAAYKSYIQEYVWGSNRFVSRKGGMFAQLVSYDLSDLPKQDNMDIAAGYLHYIHGVNPLGKVYLSNMNGFGAERSVDEFYHAWFGNDTPWDNVNSSFGPPPGFLVGGANQYYTEGDGSLEIDQPPMKSYVETNAFRNNEQSWQFTENSNGYQIEYLRLLSQFVK